MIKEAIDKIIELRDVKTFEINNEIYATNALHLIKKLNHMSPISMEFKTLQGLVDFVTVYETEQEYRVIHIVDYNKVVLVGDIQPDNENDRFEYARAVNTQLSFPFGQYHELETFIISIQSQFITDENINNVLVVIGNLVNEHVKMNIDDGMNQTVQVKTGITTKSDITIENPLFLQPFRTFREVEQPKSYFIIRIKNKSDTLKCALFESDGGKWKIDAVENIKSWLKSKLPNFNVIG